MELYILHAGLTHPSPYIYNLYNELKSYEDIEVTVKPNLPEYASPKTGIIYFNRLKRFYDSKDMKSALEFIEKIKIIKSKGWKIVWTIHTFFPIDRNITDVDEFIVREFINNTDLLFTLTEYMQDSIKKNYNRESIVHYMGINALDNQFNNDVVNLNFLPNNAFLFSFVGNIYKYKMVEEIISNFNKLNNPNSFLLIAGCEASNSKTNVDDLIKTNKNIIRIPFFIGDRDWNKIIERTNVFLNIYNLDLPAFKHGFFPSNCVKLSSYKRCVISPKSPIIEELMDNNALLLYDFRDPNGLYNIMKFSLEHKEMIKNREELIKNVSYSWKETTKIFVEGLRKLDINEE